MSAPNYRTEVLDRIRARLAAMHSPKTPMRYCAVHGRDWDSRHTTECPWCALDKQPEAE